MKPWTPTHWLIAYLLLLLALFVAYCAVHSGHG